MKTPTICAAVALLAISSSCASMFASPQAVVQLTSSPSGLPFETDYGDRGTTPASLTPPSGLSRMTVTLTAQSGQEQSFELRKRVSAWIIGNALWGIPGIVGIGIDAANTSRHVWPAGGLWHVSMTPEVKP